MATLYSYPPPPPSLPGRRGDAEGAERLYRRVLALDPAHVDALNNLGLLLQIDRGQAQQRPIRRCAPRLGSNH